MSWSQWIRIISLFFLLAACGNTMTAGERDAIAARIVDIPIHDCSISPSRAYVLIDLADRPDTEPYQIYSLTTKQPITLPDANQHAYGEPIDWMIGATHDILILQPHWLVDLSTGIVTDTRQIDPLKTSPWWGTGPRFLDNRVSPNGLYTIAQGVAYFVPTPGASPLTPTIISVENPVARLCGNAWEHDSSGLYFLDYEYHARSTSPGPLRFLAISP